MTNQLTFEEINQNTKLLIEASRRGDIDTVKRLIPVSDSKARDSLALRFAARYGYTEMVKLLLPVSDPKICNSRALHRAVEFEQRECVKLLLPVSDYNLVFNLLRNKSDTTILRQCIDEYEALLQKERLTHQLNGFATNEQSFPVKRKI